MTQCALTQVFWFKSSDDSEDIVGRLVLLGAADHVLALRTVLGHLHGEVAASGRPHALQGRHAAVVHWTSAAIFGHATSFPS